MTPNRTFDQLLVDGAATLALVAVGWLAVLLAAAAVEATTGGRWRCLTWAGCPAAWRGALLLAVSAVLVGTAAPATAREMPPEPAALLPLPERPSGGVADEVPVPSAPSSSAGTTDDVEVARGDSLWTLARDRLPDATSDADVQHLVDRVHALNRDLIGPDPDLIHPGMRLAVPPTSERTQS